MNKREEPRTDKRPATLLTGPYGHPIHPALVALPIGAWVLSVASDIASRFVDDPVFLERASYWLIGAGVLTALAAAMFGFIDFFGIPSGTKAKTIATTHMALNLVVTALFAVSFLLRDGKLSSPNGVAAFPLTISVIGAALLALSGFLGGELAYRYGVRVATEDDQREGFRLKGDR